MVTTDIDPCSICQRPKNSGATSSITQWLASCHCDVRLSAIEDEATSVCENCGKRMSDKYKGSLTQWVFAENSCKCENPKLSKATRSGYRPAKFSYGLEEVEIDSDLNLDPRNFPLQRYSPRRLLGRGALGEVYACTDNYLKKLVAVKCLLAITDDSVISFQQEAKIASKLKNESIIEILDFGVTESGRPYMVMEYFRGVSLQQLLAWHGPLNEQDFLSIFVPICDSLQYMHDRGVFHRDLKPSNILVELDGRDRLSIRLIDFGLSKSTQEMQSKTQVQGITVVGTPWYMSPDQVQGLVYDGSSEVYSLGCIMFEALSGERPFAGESALETLNCHLQEEIPSLADMEVGVTADIIGVIETCLNKQKSDRFPSMLSLRSALISANDRREDEAIQPTFKPKSFDKKTVVLFVTTLISVPVIFWQVLSSAGLRDYSETIPIARLESKGFSRENATSFVPNAIKDSDSALWIGRPISAAKARALTLQRVKSIRVTQCELSDEAWKELTRGESLEYIRVDGSVLSPRSAGYLLNTTLKSLSLEGCYLTDEHLSLSKRKKPWTSLNLQGNPKLTFKGLRHLPAGSYVLINAGPIAKETPERIEQFEKASNIQLRIRTPIESDFDTSVGAHARD